MAIRPIEHSSANKTKNGFHWKPFFVLLIGDSSFKICELKNTRIWNFPIKCNKVHHADTPCFNIVVRTGIEPVLPE